MLSVIAPGFGSPYLTQASCESPSGGPWRSGPPPIACTSANSSVTQTSRTGTVHSARFEEKHRVQLYPKR